MLSGCLADVSNVCVYVWESACTCMYVERKSRARDRYR